MSSNRNSNVSTKSTDSKNSKTFYKIKLILIGDSGVGKTSLLGRYMDEEFVPNKPCTLYAESKIKSITIDPFNSAEITIWDTCGQEKYRSVANQFFKGAHGIILMFDVCDKRSFADLNIWLEKIKNNTIKDDVSIVLCGNKIDLKFRNIKYEDAKNFAKNNDLIYCETSSKEGINVEVAFESVTKEIIKKLNKKNKFKIQEEKMLLGSTIDMKGKGKEKRREKEVKCC